MAGRLLSILVFFLLLFIAVILRLFYWQVLSSESLASLAEDQVGRQNAIYAKRGIIYTRDGSPLVINQPVFTVFGQPPKIIDKNKVQETLGALLEIPQASVSALINNDKLNWVPIKEQVTFDAAAKIREARLTGIGLNETSIRYYPESSMSAHLLGFVGKNHNGDPVGYFGLEGYYNEQLKGRPGFIKDEKDALGNPILAGIRQVITSEDGRNLYISMDKTVQFIVEKKLDEALSKYGAKSGTVTVMNPKNGEIIALAALPSYDPFKRLDFPENLYKNPVINSSYEPGSTFKILVMAAAVNEKKISPKDYFDETGPVQVGNYVIKTWNNKYHGKIKIPEILQYSSNVGMVYIADKLGPDNLLKYLKILELGKTTGIDLQDEASPVTRPEKDWYPIDYATASFGQGIAVTPLQMIRMAASIANGGKLVTPHVVTKISDKSGKTIDIEPFRDKEVFNRDTASIVTEMMVSAVEKGETKFLKPIGIKVAGKTGTAQIPIAGHYDTQKTIASFVGFFPANDPELIILVTLREPTSSPWGSETAAPLFFNITKELIAYYNIPLNN